MTHHRQSCLELTLNPYSITTTDEVSQTWEDCNTSHNLHLFLCLIRITVKRAATSRPSILRADCISAAPSFIMEPTLLLKWSFNEKP